MMGLTSDINPCHEFINVNEYLGECQDVTLLLLMYLDVVIIKHMKLFYILFLK